VDDVRVIDDVETLKVVAEPTRFAILELLTAPRSVTELAAALEVPRTRLYHHIELLRSKGIVEQVEERRVGALTERVYAPTAQTFRPGPNLFSDGELGERIEAVTTLLFDATKADFRRSLETGAAVLGEREAPRRLGLGRSVAHLTPDEADSFVAELEALVARFDKQHAEGQDARPYALVWAFYPASRTIA
jgi:DNA-binding transcriptional ArsR family regulator